MLELEQVRQQLQDLGLTQAATVFDRCLDVGARENLRALTVIRHILEEELATRH